MALSVVNNVASLQSQNNLNRTSNALSKSLERLSSGLKVNRGADGPAALVISEQQRAQIAGLRTAIDNTNKAVSVVQTGEGALNEISSLLNRARSLALDSANSDVNDSNSLAANQAELANILGTIDRIAETTKFGTKKLLDGSANVSGAASSTAVSFVKGTAETKDGSYEIKVTTAAKNAAVAATEAQGGTLAQDEKLVINGQQIDLKAGLSQTAVVAKINEFTSQTSVVAEIDASTKVTRLTTTSYGTDAKIEVQSSVAASTGSSGFGTVKQSAAGINIAGTIDEKTATGTGKFLTAVTGDANGLVVEVKDEGNKVNAVANVTVQNNALTFQIGANAGQTAAVVFINAATNALGKTAHSQFDNLGAIDLTKSSGAQDALKTIDQAINEISNARGALGAFQANTLESNANNLRAALENTTAAESVIRDTDFAVEIAQFTRLQAQVQAGSTVLGNANQITSLVAQLLRG